MVLNKELNTILKEMWRLDEKISSGINLEKLEEVFYNNHLEDIQNYYFKNNAYWLDRKNYGNQNTIT